MALQHSLPGVDRLCSTVHEKDGLKRRRAASVSHEVGKIGIEKPSETHASYVEPEGVKGVSLDGSGNIPCSPRFLVVAYTDHYGNIWRQSRFGHEIASNGFFESAEINGRRESAVWQRPLG